MFCCDGFRSMMNNVGRRGFSIVPRDSAGARYFLIQARACDAEQVNRLPTEGIPAMKDIGRITFVMETGIQYCPACGASMTEWINLNEEEFNQLVRSTGNYSLGK
jgi:hypothetical protein